MIPLNKADTANSGMFVEPMSHVPTISSTNEDDDVVGELSQVTSVIFTDFALTHIAGICENTLLH